MPARAGLSSEGGQFDLFADAPEIAAVNTLREALFARDAGRARACLKRLAALDANHRLAPRAASLIAALDEPECTASDAAGERIDRLENEWRPAADAMFGARAAAFLEPLWRGAARALEGVRFDPAAPSCHAAWAWRRAGDWENVRRAVLAEPDYAARPVLLARLAEAEYRLRRRARAIECWFALCRGAPEAFERLVEAPDFPDIPVARAWRRAGEWNVEPEITPAWFPAWMLIEEPGLARELAPRGGGDAPVRAFGLVAALLAGDRDDEGEIALRRELKTLHPALLARYLARLEIRARAAR